MLANHVQFPILETSLFNLQKSFIASVVGLGEDLAKEELNTAVLQQIGGDENMLTAIKR